MAADGELIYNFNTMAGAAEAIDTAISSMRGTLHQLETDFKPLEGDAWTSEAQVSYKAAKDRWTAASNHITEVLGQVKGAVVSSSERMQHTDRKAAGYFPG
jgi:WXG100 family type VII secretion target